MEGIKRIKGLKKLLQNLKKVSNMMPKKTERIDKTLDDETLSDLHYGDVIYLRFETELNSENNDSRPFQGYMSGDGLALNTLSIRSVSTLNRTTLTKFLFRIEPPEEVQKKRKVVKKADKPETDLKANDQDNEENEEDLDFETKNVKVGDLVLYGSELRLRHLYSKAYLQINPFSLSKEEECVEVNLSFNLNKYCNIKLFDPSQTKRPGEIVNSNDTIGMNFVNAYNFFCRVHEESFIRESMAINAGKEAGMFKIKFFNGVNDDSVGQSGTVMNGHIIRLHNKDTDHFLGVNYDPVNYSEEERERHFVAGDCEKYLHSGFSMGYIHRTKFEEDSEEQEDDDEHKEDVSKINAQQKNQNDLSCFWEIRVKNSLKETEITNSNKRGDEVLLKNILTGQFLYYDPGQQSLSLQELGEKQLDQRGFEFFIKMKNNWSSDNSVKYNSLVTIKDSVNKAHVNFFEAGHEDYEVKVSNSQNNSYRFFVVENVAKERRIAFKIKLINQYINKFYMDRKNSKAVQVDFRECVDKEERLDVKVDQIMLCLESLINVFTNDLKVNNKNSWKAEDYIQRIGSSFQDGKLKENQKWFKQNFILKNLLQLYRLILDIVLRSLYGLKELKNNKSIRKIVQILDKNDHVNQAKLPQIFLKDYLDPLLEKFYTLFYLLEYNNSGNSSLILRNFSDFYEPLQLYRFNLNQILKEATSNSDDMDVGVVKVIEKIFMDLKLPRPSKGKIKHQGIKMVFIKNILKNLLESQKDSNKIVFRNILNLWRKRIEAIYYFSFEQYNDSPCLCFHLLQEKLISNNPKAEKRIREFREEMTTFFKKMTINMSESQNYLCFRLKLSKLSSKKLEHFRKFLVYYIEIKSLFHILSADLNVPLKKINPLEKVSQRGLILKLILDQNLRWEVRKSLSDFVVQVYLHVEKYNYFTDLHDFTFFLQNIHRPVVFMNKELMDLYDSSDQDLDSLENSADEVDYDDGELQRVRSPLPPQMPEISDQEYIPLMNMEPFFHNLLSRFRQIVHNIGTPEVVTSSRENFDRFIPVVYEITFICRIFSKFLEVGFVKFHEIKVLIELLNKLFKKIKSVLYGSKIEASTAGGPSVLTQNVNSIPQKARFKPSIKLINSVTQALGIINHYRENLILLLVIKFFYQMGLRRQFSEDITNRFFSGLNGYFNILNFENSTSSKAVVARVDEFPKLKQIFQQKLDLVNKASESQGEEKLRSLMDCVDLRMEDLVGHAGISLCSDLLDILVLQLNPYYKSLKAGQTDVTHTLKFFDEAYYTKIVRQQIQNVIERYYLRCLTTFQKVLNFEFVLEDKNLKGILQEMEVTPDEMNQFNDEIKTDFAAIAKPDHPFIKKIDLLKREMSRYLKTKIYFPKVQKLSQISKWKEPCQEIISKISEQVKGAELTGRHRETFEIIRDFFVLQMMSTEAQILGEEAEVRFLFLDVFMEKGVRCDEILITIYSNMAQEVIIEDIKLLFDYIEENKVHHHFDQNKSFARAEFEGRAGEIRAKCLKLNQYLNILRSFTHYEDTRVRKEFQKQILTNLLQSDFVKRLLDSGYMKYYIASINDNIPKNFLLVQSEEEELDNFTAAAFDVQGVFQNALELVFNCLVGNSFAQLIYKSMTDYNDQMIINKYTLTPFCVKMSFYQMNFHSQFTTHPPQFKRVVDMLNSMINRDLYILTQYFENKLSQRNGEILKKITAFTKLKIKKSRNNIDDENEDEEDTNGADASDDEEGLDEKEEDSESEGELVTELDASEELEQIWFKEKEVGSFLNARMKDGSFYGFLSFLVEFTTFLILHIEKYTKNVHQSENIFLVFHSYIKDIRNMIPKFPSFFCRDSFCHALLLIEILDQNTLIILEATRSSKHTLLEPKTYRTVKNTVVFMRKPDNNLNITVGTTEKNDHLHEFNNNLIEKVMHNNSRLDRDGDVQKTLELLRFSLVALRSGFSDRIKEVFDSGIENMEYKLVKSLIAIVVDAKRVRMNHFITYDMFNECDVSYQHFTNFVRVVRQKQFDEGDLELSQMHSQQMLFALDDYEVITTCIKLQRLIYGEKTWNSWKNSNCFRPELPILDTHTNFNFLEELKKKYMRGKSLKNFINNQNLYSNFLECLQKNIFHIQKNTLESNTYIKKLSFELFGLKISQFQRVFKRKKIDKCLSSRKNRFLLLHSLKQTVIGGMITFNPQNDLKVNQQLQKNLSKRFIGLFALRMITSSKEDIVIKTEAMELLYYLLVNGNAKVQRHLFNTIKENYDFVSIVDCFEKILKNLHRRILKGLNKIGQNRLNKLEKTGDQVAILKNFLELDDFEIINKCFQLLQVFTENCHSDFQNLFREQTFGDRKTNNNLIQHVIDITISLGKFIVFDKSRFNDETTQVEGAGGLSDSGSQTNEDSNTQMQVVGNQSDISNMVVYKNESIDRRILLAQKGQKKDELTHVQIEISESENKKLKELIHLGIHFINDCMMGPNEPNQKLVNSNVGLINFACSIIRRIQFDKDDDLSLNLLGETDMYDFRIFGDAVNMLLFASNGNIKLEDMAVIYNKENVSMFKDQVQSIYQKIIRANKRRIISKRECLLNHMNEFQLEHELVDESGQSDSKKEIRNVMLKNHLKRSKTLMSTIRNLKTKKEKVHVAKKLNVAGCTPWHCKEGWGLINSLYKGVIEAGHNLFILIKKFEETQEKEIESGYTEYYNFYNNFYGKVEIVKDDKISIARYTKPYSTHFHYDKESILSEFKIEPYAEKIKNFMNRNKFYEDLLSFRQRLFGTNMIFYYLLKNRKHLATLLYLILLVINLMLLFDVSQAYDSNFDVTDSAMDNTYDFFKEKIKSTWPVIFYLGVVNAVLAFFIYLFRLIDNQKDIYLLQQKCKKNRRFYNSIAKREKAFDKLVLRLKIWLYSGFRKYLVSNFNFINLYNLALFGLSILALEVPLVYPFLLLDIIHRSSILKNIIRAISLNSSQLINTTILTLIIMFIYSTISFTYLSDHFKHQEGDEWKNYCFNLKTCFISILNNGLRAGGGMGEALGQPTLADTRFYFRTWLDLSFMILILIILLNIVFGIIIDTFGDMRNERNAWKDYVNNTCLICDLSKTDIDSEGEGYYKHINVSHSVEDYVYFMIYVKNKDLNDCDGLEQYVKQMSQAKNYAFMPNQESFHYQDDLDL